MGGKMLRSLIVLTVFFTPAVVHCERQFTVLPGDTLCTNSTWNSASSLPVGRKAHCSGLSELLQIVSSNIAPGDSVAIDVEGGNEYSLDTSTYFLVPNVSIAIKGVNWSNSNRPRIICSLNLTSTLATTLYALRFGRSNSVVIDRLEFVGCPRSLSFVDMLKLTITNSLFRDFTEGVLSIADCNVVHLENSTIRDNKNTVLREDVMDGLTSRGNAGGVSISYEKLIFHEPALTFNVINCDFINDSTTSSLATSAFTTFLVQNRVFAGTAGGLAIYLSDENIVIGNIQGCLFKDNYATYYGGGLFLVESKLSSPSHRVTIVNNSFISNHADIGGGGAVFGYIGSTQSGQLLTVYVSECHFERNMARAGGGIFDISSFGNGKVTQIIIDNSTFQRNSATELGGAYAVISFAQGFVTLGYGEQDPRIITNCIFKDNHGDQGGTVSLLYFPVRFDGTNTFNSNTGPTVRVIGTVMSVNGTIRLHDNSAMQSDGGALYSTSFGQVLLYKGSNLNFTKNRGNLGASVVAETQKVLPIFQQLLNNPLCFLLYEEKGLVPNEWSEIGMLFEENDGYVGPVAYLNKLKLCAWGSVQPPYFNLDDVLKWKFVDYRRNDNINRGRDRNNKNEDYYIQTPAVNFIIDEDEHDEEYFPNQPIEVTIEATDELGHFTSEFFRFTDSLISATNVMTMLMQSRRGRNMDQNMMSDQETNDDGSILLDASPSLIASMPKSKKYEIRYHFEGDSNAVMPSYYNLERELSVDSPLLLNLEEKMIRIESKRCPPGFILKRTSGVWGCQCNNDLDELIECVPQIGLLLQEGHWTYSYRDRDAVVFYQCPPGYCRCDRLGNISDDTACYAVLPNDDSDGQCVCDRKGVLCGECRNGMGVSALLNRCVDCSNVNALLIVTLIIIDAVIVLILLRWNRPFPTWLYPCVFYLQMAPYITEDFPVTFSKVHRYLYYISSVVSLYFPYDFCLYNGMTALESFSIRYIPFFVSVTIISLLLIIRRFVHQLQQYRFRHGIWFLVILQYSHVVHTSMSLLNCHSVPVSTDMPGEAMDDIRWYWDGSVQCFHGDHIPLGLLAIFILIFSTSLVVTMLLSHFYLTFKKPFLPFILFNFLRVASVPASLGYKDHCKGWASVELGRRLILLVFIIAFGHNEIPVLFVLMIILGVYTFVFPHKDYVINVVECLSCTNLILMILLRNTANIVEELSVLVTDSNEPVVDGSCNSDSSGVTILTALLTPFYYLFLVVPVGYCMFQFPWRQLWDNSKEIYKRFRPQTIATEDIELKVPRAYNVTEVGIDVVDGEVTVSSSVDFQ